MMRIRLSSSFQKAYDLSEIEDEAKGSQGEYVYP